MSEHGHRPVTPAAPEASAASLPPLPQPSVGLCVVHLFLQLPATHREAAAVAIEQAVADVRAADGQVVVAALLGHKGDVAVMGLARDPAVLRRLQTELTDAGLRLVDSYVSLTEISEYAQGVPDAMKQARLYPQLPPEGRSAFCFYPMSKRREATGNWFTLPYDDRHELMMEHGTSGRRFAGRVLQVVTGSTGLDRYEWGVTLFAQRLDDLKEVVYTMRFDQASAVYGEFGDFYTGYVTDVRTALGLDGKSPAGTDKPAPL